MIESRTTETPEVHPVVAKILERRKILPQDWHDYFSWDLKSLPDMTDLIDLDKASRRIILAIDAGEKIGIYGDYDVDGTTSCALFGHFFRMLGVEVELFQPSRFVEGYGVHPESIEAAINKGVKVLITVDCGISNVETAEYAKERDIDLIITDHHKDAAPHLPNAYAVVNPNRRDEPEGNPLTVLAGVTVAFCVCLKVKMILEKEFDRSMPSLYPLLQFVGIGTICDLAKLTPVNLKLTRHGLKQIPDSQYPGILSFFTNDELSRGSVPSESISFGVGPIINSKGRLDHPERALKLLMAKNSQEALGEILHLKEINLERKRIQNEVFHLAKKEAIKQVAKKTKILLTYSPEFHEGVIGIVASKLVETFKLPAIVLTDSEVKGIIKGSARTAGNLNLFELLNNNRDLFIKFGGHKAAAGLSMPKEKLHKLRDQLNKELSDIPEIVRTTQDSFDCEISFCDITPDLIAELDKMEPFGMGNAKPLFRMRDAKLVNFQILKDTHVKWTFQSADQRSIQKLSGISFFYLDGHDFQRPSEIFQNQQFGIDVYFELGINYFRGNKTIQLMVKRIKTL